MIHCYSVFKQLLVLLYNITIISGITLTASTTAADIGTNVTFKCSSDLNPTEIVWYRGNHVISRETYTSVSVITVQSISTDSQGMYICKAVSNNGSQARNITLNVKGNFYIIG